MVSRLLFLAFLFGAFATPAQELRTNDKGEKIVVFPDGSWYYFNQPREVEQEGLSQAELEKLKEERSKSEIIELAEKARREEQALKRELNQAVLDRILPEEELETMLLSRNAVPKAALDAARNRLIEKREAELKLLEQYETARADARFLENALFLPRAKREKQLAQWRNEVANRSSTAPDREKIEEEVRQKFPTPEPGRSKPKRRAPRKLVAYDPQKDVLWNPPAPKCKFIYEGKDELTGQTRRDVEPQIFFTYTREELRRFLKNREYLTCYGNLTGITGGYRFLNLEFQIAAPNARVAFGSLPQNSLLEISLLNGETVRLLNKKADNGYYDNARQVYVYRGQYPISARQEKLLEEGEVDRVRVVWSEGFDDYEVYEVDFFRQQFACLNSR